MVCSCPTCLAHPAVPEPLRPTGQTYWTKPFCSRQRWESVASLAQPRAGAAAALLDSAIVVCGGHDGAQVLNSVERLREGSISWESTAKVTPKIDPYLRRVPL